MNFRLKKQETGATLTKFYVLDSTNSIVGHVSVANKHAEDLQKQWRTPEAAPAAKRADAKAALRDALLRVPRLKKAALLRS